MSARAAQGGRDVLAEVVVVGAGLAGLATAIHLAGDGRQVVVVEPRSWPRPAVGESLEFSAPRLLTSIGVDLEAAIGARQLFPKTSVRIVGRGEDFTVWPPAWFARPPIWCSRTAFHTDRTELDRALFHLAVERGAEVLPERVVDVDCRADRIAALTTDQRTIRASWYVDATGHNRRLFGRALGIETEVLGRTRAACWARVGHAPMGHATTLYVPDPQSDELTWMWEIPLNVDELSLGLVMDAATFRACRSTGSTPHEIFERRLGAVPRLGRILGEHPCVELFSTSYVPYRHRRPVGPNWVLVGDASAMVDPLTSNGVTSALRHAEQAASIVADALDNGTLSRRRALAYRHTAPATVATLDHAIEAFLYQPAVRRIAGLRWAVTLYAATGVITNSLYARLHPTTAMRSIGCAAMLLASRGWVRIARVAFRRRARPGGPREPVPVHTRSEPFEGARHATQI